MAQPARVSAVILECYPASETCQEENQTCQRQDKVSEKDGGRRWRGRRGGKASLTVFLFSLLQKHNFHP